MAPHAPTLQNPIQTPRLNLVRIHDTTPNSQHHLWFHELWADEELTAWSLRGPTHTLQESLDWMRERETKYGDINYGIFEKNAESKGTLEDPGLLIGSISLRLQATGPDLLPPPPPKQSYTSTSSEANGVTNRPLNLRVIGYAIRETHWGKGYATEFGKALVAAWSAYIADEKAKGEELFYMEGVADKDNPASQRVLEKLGFERVGWKDEDEPVFLAGKWRDPGYWVYGLWL